jgi:succinate dehydrogenase / fumarate reductase, iron-sulfur subunit
MMSTKRVIKFEIYRYDPDKDDRPYMQKLEVELEPTDKMLLDALLRIKLDVDDSLALRRSCREGVCGSDAMNINGKNGLACTTNLNELKQPIVLRPLPGLPVIRDLIVDMTHFFNQYHSIKPYLINDTPPPEKERLQSPDAHLFGGTQTNLWAQRACYRLIGLLPIAVIKPRQSVSIT